jgi:Fic/DOC family
MQLQKEAHFSGPVIVFHEKRLPERATPVGYAALIDAYNLQAPWPRVLSAISERHRLRIERGWQMFGPRYAPEPTLEDHLTFALKNEGLDLTILKRLFQQTGPAPIENIVKNAPTGAYARRLWFLYEWLLGQRLDLADAESGRYIEAVDTNLQWASDGKTSSRHRVKDNLPGTPQFCPMVFRTETLARYAAANLSERAAEVAAKVPKDILTRTAAFLLLKDSKSSYAIEGERPPQDRIQRWGRAIGEAGQHELDRDELLRLQKIVIGDERFVRLGFRTEGGFVGEHDRDTRAPLPDHIDARPEDLEFLIAGLVEFDHGAAQTVDPVIAAAVLAFGFVYIHPFADGNGRIHRYLIHHVLAKRGFNPPGVVFPLSAAILESIDRYRDVLESYSTRLLPFVEWEATPEHNVRVLNDTGDFYRFFDATPHAEFLYECVERTIERDLPNEADFLRRFDEFRTEIERIVEMPERTLNLLFRFLCQNEGQLSGRAKEREFAALSENEVGLVENAYRRSFVE